MTRKVSDASQTGISPSDSRAVIAARAIQGEPTLTVGPTPELSPAAQDETSPFIPRHALKWSSGQQVTQIGEYELLGEIARGGMGIVYKARDCKLNRVVALKVARGGQLASGSEAKRFQAEAEAAAKLDHPHIVPIYEVGEVDGLQFISMAFVEGQSLAKRVAAGPLPPREAAALIRQVATAVGYAHSQGVIHRDLKPGNIMLDAAGQPRVTDFGLAKLTDADSSLTQAGQVMGTPNYMPPEQAEGENEQVGPLADIYSLGSTLYCLITGRPPFQSANVMETLKQVVERKPVAPRSLNHSVDRDLDTIVLKCLQKRPEKRYGSATALAEDLERYLDRRPILARPVGDVEKMVRWCRRNPVVATSLAGIVAILVTAFVMVSWNYWRAEDARKEEATQRRAADLARDDAQQKEKAERWERYRANMIAAGSAMQLHNVSAARSALDAAPQEHRNWEWHYFINQLDTAKQVVRVGDDIRAMAVSPDSTLAAVQSAGGPTQLWNLSTRQKIGALPNRSTATRFWFSPDSKIVAYAVADHNTIFHWDIAAIRERAVLSGLETQDLDLQFSPNGTRLAAASLVRTVPVFDTATGKQLFVLHGHKDQVARTVFSPDGRRIASAGMNDRTARLWNAETGQSLAILGEHGGPVSQAIFNPQGDRVLSIEMYPGNALRLWDAGTGKLLAVLRGHINAASTVAFSPDGTRIASGSLDQTIRLWDGRTGQPLSSRDGHRGDVTTVAFSPDGKSLLSASKDQTVRIWDATNGTPLGVLHGHTGAIQEARFTPDGRTIVTASVADGTVRLWDARSAQWNGSLHGHKDFVYDVSFHPDGERVASAAWDDTVRIWDATTGREISRFGFPSTLPPPEKTIVSSVAFHPDGKLIAAFGREGAVRFWDLTTEKEAFCFRLSPGSYGVDPRVAFSSQGNLLAASGGSNNSVHILDVESRAEVAVLQGHRDAVSDVVFSPDDSWMASAGSDRTIRIWNLVKMEQAHVLEGHTGEIRAVAVSRDGKWLASGSLDGTVRLWDTTTWKQVAVLKHGTFVYGVAFTPDGTRLACACANSMIRLWDMKTFQLVAELEGHAAYVHQIAWSPDGTRLVSGSGDKTLRIWDSLSVRERAKRKMGTAEK